MFLQPGETQEVQFVIEREGLGVWDTKFRGESEEQGAWQVENGQYAVEICVGREKVKRTFEILEDAWERGL